MTTTTAIFIHKCWNQEVGLSNFRGFQLQYNAGLGPSNSQPMVFSLRYFHYLLGSMYICCK